MSIVHLQDGGNSPELHAREFLAIRLHHQKAPTVPSIKLQHSLNSTQSHHNMGETFQGILKRNSNAVLTNTSQIRLSQNAILASSSSNIIKPRFDKSSPSPDTRFGSSSAFLGTMSQKFGNLQNTVHKVSTRFTIKDLQ